MNVEKNMKDLETIVANLTGCTRQIANTVVNAIIECIDKDNNQEEQKMKYYICNGTVGAGNYIANTLDEAMQMADENAEYTQANIFILENANDKIYRVCCRRLWWGVPFDKEICDDTNPIDFGGLGYYGDWE